MLKKSIASFDIETVPDYDLARRINPELSDADDVAVIEWLAYNRNTNKNFPDNTNVFLKSIFHKVVSISFFVWTTQDGFTLCKFNEDDQKPKEFQTLQNFYNTITFYGGPNKLQLLSFNGKGFDSAVCFQRAMHNKVQAAAFFDKSDNAKYNNYINKYHDAHLDLLQALGLDTEFGRTRLSDALTLVGLPPKIGVGGSDVESAYRAGEYKEIHDYCDMDSILTFMLYTRYASTVYGDVRRLKDIKADLWEFLSQNAHLAKISKLLELCDVEAWLLG